VQDLSAQHAARLLELGAGQRVLDACAAPGGKTGHILEALAGRGELWAVDRDGARLDRVRENLARLGLEAKLVTGDATEPTDWWDGTPFDRILLDAPCSATGVIRRHPEIKVVRRPADIDRAVALQTRLLRALWPLLRAGGRLVYATCSVLRRENDEQIAAFRAAEPTIEADPAVASLQLLPEEARGDGFYYAWLRKPHALRMPSVSPAQP
jgi:16S rRNA (cytosine967-C5)-methyltransferase